MKSCHEFLELETSEGIQLHDITQRVRESVQTAGVLNGVVTIISQHTTTAITINENEARLLKDIDTFFTRLVPADQHYLHNDIHLRDCPDDEPENAHSHLIAMLLGSSESIAVVDGELALGQWQSIMMVELDGPRTRKVSVQVLGTN